MCDPLVEQLMHERSNPRDLGAIIITLGDLDDRNEVAKQQKRLRNGAVNYDSPTPADRQHCQGVCGTIGRLWPAMEPPRKAWPHFETP